MQQSAQRGDEGERLVEHESSLRCWCASGIERTGERRPLLQTMNGAAGHRHRLARGFGGQCPIEPAGQWIAHVPTSREGQARRKAASSVLAGNGPPSAAACSTVMPSACRSSASLAVSARSIC